MSLSQWDMFQKRKHIKCFRRMKLLESGKNSFNLKRTMSNASLKNNKFIRGLCFFYRSFFGISRRDFGSIGKEVTLTPPYNIQKLENVFIGDQVGIGPYAYLTAYNAKLIIKGNCSIAEHFTVHTGNHARLIGRYVTDIT